ncbi:MAG: hypothetical protein AAGI17_00555 [Planctomycetota bacterium]
MALAKNVVAAAALAAVSGTAAGQSLQAFVSVPTDTSDVRENSASAGQRAIAAASYSDDSSTNLIERVENGGGDAQVEFGRGFVAVGVQQRQVPITPQGESFVGNRTLQGNGRAGFSDSVTIDYLDRPGSMDLILVTLHMEIIDLASGAQASARQNTTFGTQFPERVDQFSMQTSSSSVPQGQDSFAIGTLGFNAGIDGIDFGTQTITLEVLPGASIFFNALVGVNPANRTGRQIGFVGNDFRGIAFRTWITAEPSAAGLFESTSSVGVIGDGADAITVTSNSGYDYTQIPDFLTPAPGGALAFAGAGLVACRRRR